MRNLYKIFNENIEKEEKRIESEKEQLLNDKIKDFYEKIEFIKNTSDLNNCFEKYLDIVREINNVVDDYKLENNIEASYNFKKMLYYFELNTVNMLYNRVISLYNTNMNESLISIYNTIKSFEVKEIPSKTNTVLDMNTKIIIENNIKEIDNKITILESENNKRRREYEINEVRGYYTYKLFIQMLIDRLYMESTNNPNKDILDREIVFTFKILLSKVIEKDNEIIKLPTDVEIHFKEFIKLFVERNNFKETNISNDIPKMTYYIKAKIKDLLDACYREIQGFEYNDDLIEETIYDENIILNKDCENPLTLKIE